MHSIGGLVVKLAVAIGCLVVQRLGQPRVRFPADAMYASSSWKRYLLLCDGSRPKLAQETDSARTLSIGSVRSGSCSRSKLGSRPFWLVVGRKLSHRAP
jgi:hypothetical protein